MSIRDIDLIGSSTSGGVVSAGDSRSWSRNVRTREATLDDYDGIASLHLRNGLAVTPRRAWEALWQTNPFFRHQQAAEWPTGWVLETPDAQIVGAVLNIPLEYRFRDRNLRVSTLVGTAVDVPFRGYSLWLVSRALEQPGVDLYIGTTMSLASEPLFRFFKWLPVPVGKWDRSAFWITAYHGFLKASLRAKSLPTSPLVSYPCAAALFAADRLRQPRWESKGASCDIELCSDFDERFDGFWQELESRNQDALLAVRSGENLRWHFRSGLLQQSIRILAAYKGSHMIGYAIFDRVDNSLLGLKRVRLVDFWALENSEEVLRSILGWMLDKCRREGIHMLEIVGWEGRPEFRHIRAPHHRSLGAWIYYYKACNSELAEALTDPKTWFPTLFDGDACL